MEIYITGRNSSVTDSMKKYIQEKLNKIEKYTHKNMSVYVILDAEKYRFIAEVNINTNLVKIHCREESDNMFTAIDKIVDKLERQMRKTKEKIQDHKNVRRFVPVETDLDKQEDDDYRDDFDEDSISVSLIDVDPKTLSISQAVQRSNELHYQIYLYKNSETGKINTLYKLSETSYEMFENKDEFKEGVKKLVFTKSSLEVTHPDNGDVFVKVSSKEDFYVDSMTIKNAALKLKSVGSQYIMFLDENTGKLGLMFFMTDGNLGLMEPEI